MIAPASYIPPTVDTAHGRHCICHTCKRRSRPVWIHPNVAALCAATFNQGKV